MAPLGQSAYHRFHPEKGRIWTLFKIKPEPKTNKVKPAVTECEAGTSALRRGSPTHAALVKNTTPFLIYYKVPDSIMRMDA